MAGKRTKTRKKIKLNKKLVCTIGVLLLIIAVIFAIIMIFKPVNVGKINKEGKAEYIERVANVTKYPDKKIVEFKNDYELNNEEIIKNKNILILDDIYTTGATCNECVKTLRNAQPKKIGIITIAKDCEKIQVKNNRKE